MLQQARMPGCFVWQEQPITCEDSEPEPDLSIIGGREDDFLTEHPRTAELVIEVCVTSHDYDRAYAAAGVREVWLVLGPEKQLEVHRRPDGERFEECVIHGPGGQYASQAVPELTVDLAALFGT